MQKYTLLTALFTVSALFAAAEEPAQIPHSYNGVAITPETLYNLMPQLPDADRIALECRLAAPDTQALVSQLLSFSNFPNWRAKMQADNAHLQTLNMPNSSQWNYVFKMPKQNFVIKIAGPINRLQSILMAHGFWPGESVTKPISKVDTYQTASRAAYYLILKDLIQKQKFKYVSTPDTYLVHYPCSAKTVDDEHVFILQRALPASAKALTPALAQSLSDDTISEIVQAIIGGGLWSIKENLFIESETNKLHATVQLVDLEQPNNSAPADFFHKDATRYYGNLRAGLEEFIDLFAGNNEKLLLIRRLIETNPVFNSPNFNQRYKNELINVLNTKAPHHDSQTE